jgi:hypothetical protein
MKPASSTSNPLGGNISPVGSSNLTAWPASFSKVSVKGLKVRSPAIANAVVISGEATKACVFGLPSFLFAKFRLKEVMIEFLLSGSLV